MSQKDNKAKADPGWNDPPVFSYESHETHSRLSKGITLTKRVVFPIQNSNVASPKPECQVDSILSSKVPLTPPLAQSFMGHPPKNEVTNNVKQNESVEENVVDEETKSIVDVPSLDIVLRNFDEVIKKIFQEDRELSEIKRRLVIMEKMWNEGKFNATVKEKIYKLSLGLKDDRIEECDSLQKSLMVDHTNVCSNWMAAIRKLIYRKTESSTS